MASAAIGLVFALVGIIAGAAALILGIWGDPGHLNWLYIVFGGFFLFWGWQLAVGALRWMRMIPAESLRLFHNHFSLAGRDYPYSAILGVKLERTRIHKSLNFVASGEDERVIARLRLTDKEVLLRAGVGPTSNAIGSHGSSEVELLMKKLALLEWRAKQPDDIPLDIAPSDPSVT